MNTISPEEMNKYFIYCRRSSEQEDRQVLSLDSQEVELTKLAKDQDLNIVGIYKESGSAHVIGRKIFNEMLSRIENGEANSLIVWDESRIARNSKDGGNVIYMIDLGQIIEIRKPGKIYQNTPDDKSWLGMLFTMSKKDSDDKGINVKRGLKTKAEKGWLPSGAKAGYMNDRFAEKGNKTILTDPKKFLLIRRVWDCMLTGTYTVMQILKLLNDEWGYRTTKHKRIGGKPMTRSQIYKTLTDPFYYGEFEYPTSSDIWYQGKHQAMISKEEFEKVQRLLGRKGRPRSRTRSFAYTGLLECGECHATITAEEKFQIICPCCKYKFASQNTIACPKCKILIEEMQSPTLLHYIYYHCTKRKNPNCTQRSIRVEDLEKQFDGLLLKLQISERFKNWAIKYLNEISDKETNENIATLKSLQLANTGIEIQLSKLLKLKISPQNIDDSLLNNEDYRNEKERLTSEKKRIIERLGGNNYKAENWRETAEKTFDFVCHARYWFANGDMQTKREILARLGSNLILIDKTVRVDLEKPLQFIELALKEEPTISEMFEPNEKSQSTTNLEVDWLQLNPLLESWDSYRRVDWINEIEYPEFTSKEVNRFLANFS